MRRGTLRPNEVPPGHAVPHCAPACPPLVPSVPRDLSLVCPSPPPIGGDQGTGPRSTRRFTATTCRKCGAIVLAGIADGILRKLEPRVLDDLTEYQALADGVPTYNLHPDRQVTRRGYAHIIADTRHPRLPAHVCGKSYASLPLPTPPRPPVKGDEPEF